MRESQVGARGMAYQIGYRTAKKANQVLAPLEISAATAFEQHAPEGTQTPNHQVADL
eukprot:COSAG03_NODE_20006_length_326_cov_0.682819_1_plen_57_part_00